MLFLLISVCLSVAVSVLLKLARRRQLEVTQMVAVNYPVAALLTWLLAQPSWANADGFWSWWWLFVLLGVLLPLVFVIMGRAVQAAGIVRADAAQRVALVIPLLAAFLPFGERLSWWSAAGIALVFAALAALLQRDSSAGEGDGRHAALWLTGVWLGYGVIDVLLKRLSLATDGKLFALLLVIFVLAALLSFAFLWARGTRWRRDNVLAGMALGALNFGNIFCYLKAHVALKDHPSVVFAGMNVGVIVLGALVGAGVFRERLSRVNVAGVALALVAVGCLTYARLAGA